MMRPAAHPAPTIAGDALAALGRVQAHVAAVHHDAVTLDGLLQGCMMVEGLPDAGHALAAMLELAQAKARAINRALDSVNLPDRLASDG